MQKDSQEENPATPRVVEHMPVELKTNTLIDTVVENSEAEYTIADACAVVRRSVDVIITLYEGLNNAAYSAHNLIGEAEKGSYGGVKTEVRVSPHPEAAGWLMAQATALLGVSVANRWRINEFGALLNDSLDQIAEMGHRVEAVAESQATETADLMKENTRLLGLVINLRNELQVATGGGLPEPPAVEPDWQAEVGDSTDG